VLVLVLKPRLNKKKTPNNYYGEEGDDSTEAAMMSEWEASCLEPAAGDRETWRLVQQNFDLSVFHLGTGIAGTPGPMVPAAAAEEIVDDSDDHDFNMLWSLQQCINHQCCSKMNTAMLKLLAM